MVGQLQCHKRPPHRTVCLVIKQNHFCVLQPSLFPNYFIIQPLIFLFSLSLVMSTPCLVYIPGAIIPINDFVKAYAVNYSPDRKVLVVVTSQGKDEIYYDTPEKRDEALKILSQELSALKRVQFLTKAALDRFVVAEKKEHDGFEEIIQAVEEEKATEL